MGDFFRFVALGAYSETIAKHGMIALVNRKGMVYGLLQSRRSVDDCLWHGPSGQGGEAFSDTAPSARLPAQRCEQEQEAAGHQARFGAEASNSLLGADDAAQGWPGSCRGREDAKFALFFV